MINPYMGKSKRGEGGEPSPRCSLVLKRELPMLVLELQVLFCNLEGSHVVHMGCLARHNMSSDSFSCLFLAIGNIEQIH